jgi:transglutaminase-like putative cysteine protease
VSEPASARLKIRHVTGFSYDGAARASYNEARMTPVTSAHQTVLSARITTTPNAVQSTYRDFFGTVVTVFDLQKPHSRLEVTAEATVDTTPPAPLEAPWSADELRDPAVEDRFCEYLVPTPRTTLDAHVLDEARSQFCELDVHAAAHAATDWVRGQVRYVTGSTNVTSTADEVWRQGEGVCQDLTHVTIAVLRSLGIPARYVSGYLHPIAGSSIGEAVMGQSHAWVEYFGGQWVGIDPTNGGEVGIHHVVVASGREYGDVPPLKGIYHGEPSRALGVVVEITQLS